MRKLKNVFAVALSLIMIFSMMTVAFATNLDYENEIEVSAVVTPAEAKAGDTVTVAFYFKDKAAADKYIELTSGGTISFIFSYDNSVVTKTGITAGYSLSGKDIADKNDDTVFVLVEPAATLNITETEAVATCTFKVNDGVSAGSYDIIKSITTPYIGDLEGMEAGTYVTAIDKLTVKGAEATKYTVTFDTDGGSTIDSQQVEEGKFATVPAEPTKDGYTFKGWDKDIATTAITANTTFKALWERNAATAPTVGTTSEAYEDAANYTNVWVGKYFAEPATDTKLTSFGVKYADKAEATFTKDMTGIEGDARIEFSVALIGVPTVDAISGTPFATADWK